MIMNFSPYLVALIIAVTGFGAEWLSESPGMWAKRTGWIVIALIGACFSTAILVALWPGVLTALLVLITVYRAVNLMRLTQNRWPDKYLQKVARRTTWVLILAQIVLVGLLAWRVRGAPVTTSQLVTGLAIA